MKFFVLKKCLKRNVSISFSVSNRWIICEQKEFENLLEKSFQILCHQIRSTRRQKWKNRESMKINFETFFIHSSCNKWKDTIALKSLCHCVWVRIPWSTGDRETERNRQRERHLAKYSFPFCPGLCQKNPGFCLGWRAEVDLKLENFLFKNCLFSFKWNCTWAQFWKSRQHGRVEDYKVDAGESTNIWAPWHFVEWQLPWSHFVL